jgi:hypothetical protein
MTMGRRSDAANRPGDHAKQSGHQREAAAQLPILALLDQGPGSARPRGACPRYAAGSAAPPMGYSRSLLPRSNFQTSVATQSLNSTTQSALCSRSNRFTSAKSGPVLRRRCGRTCSGRSGGKVNR